MTNKIYDIIVIGSGSGGLTVGLFMAKAGFKVLMVSKTDKDIGGDCLNDGCVPSKALIHVSRIAHDAKIAANFGLSVSGKVDIKKAVNYVYDRQEIIREHENAGWLQEQGVDVALGNAIFIGKSEIEVNEIKYTGKKIVIATGSRPKKLKVPGVEKVTYYDNESIFHINDLPEKLLVIGAGPIGIEIAQAMNRLGSKVTVIQHGNRILAHDDETLADILLEQMRKEGIEFIFNADVDHFISPGKASVKFKDGKSEILYFDAVFVGIGRELDFGALQLDKAGIAVEDNRIVKDKYLRTTNKNIFVCGDIAGDLMFSHAAEFHGRILLNNFFSPLKKELNNDHLSWVTFTDPELASFGLNEKQLNERNISYKKIEQNFKEDDRAVVDNYQYAKTILFISEGGIFNKERILGGTMLAPHAGEIIQELILANTSKLSVNSIFNKIYPYPVASRINQQIIAKHKEGSLTNTIKKLLNTAYKIFS
ncbi:NAD(P)/FAD-dependent oxidoreductase [Flavobacteriaceae bacterium F89]|uniref:NAD(P)/FAD-dependent oxidoreductase n=1 Tax=Cerina litoralis TaxID=2874477 RepID=A0AAE3JSM5_9FLAO|nr:NAD(P)/FAD-dependent oxidoreductase [Cerina litoralis]MCG2462673.1 NAD(P)/FAD-dependent oxidoreductase [Cerina litoralis]